MSPSSESDDVTSSGIQRPNMDEQANNAVIVIGPNQETFYYGGAFTQGGKHSHLGIPNLVTRGVGGKLRITQKKFICYYDAKFELRT